MDIPKIATKFAELYASYAKKSVATLEQEHGKKFKDEHRNAANILKASADALREIAYTPSKAERDAIEGAGVGIKVKVMKDKPWEKCLDGYEVVSDLRGDPPSMYSNGFVLRKDGKPFFATCVDFMDAPPGPVGDDDASPVKKFTDVFTRTVKVTKHASEKGISLPVVDTFVCFHAESFFGCIVFEGKPSMKLWHDHVSGSVKGNIYAPKNRSLVAKLNNAIAPATKAKMDKLHDEGVIFAFHGYGWLDTSGVVVDFEGDKPIDIFPLNYSSSAMVADLVKDATINDYRILERLQEDHNEAREKRKLAIELAAADLVKDGLIAA